MPSFKVTAVGLSSARLDVQRSGPEDPEHFAVWLDLEVEATEDFRVFGPEVFSLCVCTPKWLAEKTATGPLWGHTFLVVKRWDFKEIESTTRRLCEDLRVRGWPAAIAELSRYMRAHTLDPPAP
jgi:immunity protein 8 of polymorphic toxin system